MSYVSTVVADSPALFWRLNETSGTTAKDWSDGVGNGTNTGTYSGSFTLNQTPATPYGDNAALIGAVGNTTTGVTSSYAPFVSSSQRTFEGWAYANSSPASRGLFGAASATAPNLFFDSASQLGWYPKNASEDSWAAAWPGTGQWVYWVLTWNDSTKTAELFINGTSQGQRTTTTDVYTSPGNYEAGCSGSTIGFSFPGLIAGYAIYTSILTSTQITNHYNAATGGGAVTPSTFSVSDPTLSRIPGIH